MGNHNVSFMQYMRAHGNTPGPTQRPRMTGAVAGLTALLPSLAILHWSGAMHDASISSGYGFLPVFLVDTAMKALAGVFYGAIFKRAANDREGGWLFGISFGFLLWMLGPVTLWQSLTGRPLAVGTAAIGLFASQILYGLFLGLLYPRIHEVIQSELRS